MVGHGLGSHRKLLFAVPVLVALKQSNKLK